VIDTYVLGVTSLAPAHPHLLATSSYDGTILVLDIRSPQANIATSTRQRGPAPCVTTHPFWGGILLPEEFTLVRFNSLRPVKWGAGMATHGAPIWDVAGSVGGMGTGVHPLVISGGSDGVCQSISGTSRLLAGHNVPTPRFWTN